jgi:outer membrane lipoprotein-sorting protein
MPQAVLPPDQTALVAQAEAALTAMPAFQARFQENSGPAAVATGRIWMARGRMRVEYDPPSRQLLIASRGQVIHHDPLLGSTSHLPVSSTPLGPLLADPPRLADPSLLVQEVRRQPGILRVRVAQARRPREGSVEVLLEERSAAMQLLGWNVRDGQGREIAVRLADVRPLPAPHERLFTFLDPAIFGADANYHVPR